MACDRSAAMASRTGDCAAPNPPAEPAPAALPGEPVSWPQILFDPEHYGVPNGRVTEREDTNRAIGAAVQLSANTTPTPLTAVERAELVAADRAYAAAEARAAAASAVIPYGEQLYALLQSSAVGLLPPLAAVCVAYAGSLFHAVVSDLVPHLTRLEQCCTGMTLAHERPFDIRYEWTPPRGRQPLRYHVVGGEWWAAELRRALYSDEREWKEYDKLTAIPYTAGDAPRHTHGTYTLSEFEGSRTATFEVLSALAVRAREYGLMCMTRLCARSKCADLVLQPVGRPVLDPHDRVSHACAQGQYTHGAGGSAIAPPAVYTSGVIYRAPQTAEQRARQLARVPLPGLRLMFAANSF